MPAYIPFLHAPLHSSLLNNADSVAPQLYIAIDVSLIATSATVAQVLTGEWGTDTVQIAAINIRAGRP